ncbi:MAG TPA: hypothetical protein VKW09_11115 [bacterium]|nr:hypothetical protein [bacterium]
MSGVFDSVGLSLAFAGVMILLAGLFLTPMREMVLNGLRSRFEHEIALPPVTMQMPPVPRRIPPAPVHMPSPPIEMATAPIQMSSGAQPAWAHAAAADTPADAATAAREQEALFARALVTAHKTAEDLVRRANAEAQDIIDKAQAAANDIVGSARRSASELLQKAEQEAQLIVEDANERATDRLALLQTEVERLVDEANQTFQAAQQSVEQNVASLLSRLDAVTGHVDAEPRGAHGPAASAPGAPPAAGVDGGFAWAVPPSGDERSTVGVGADGGRAADRRSGRLA